MATGRDAGSPVPLYHRVYVVLREQILEGAYGPGRALPSEHDLARQFQVSRVTVRRALEALEADGMVLRQRGRGTFAIPSKPVEPLRADLTGLLATLAAMGAGTSVELIRFEYVPASPLVAEALEIAPGATVQRAVRVRRVDGKPMSHLTTCVPEDLGRTFSRRDLARRPLLSLLERAGVHPSAADQTITATLADAAVAERLETQVGAALLSISRVVRDQSGRPVEFLRALYRPDVYAYRMTLSRDPNQPSVVWNAAG
ncbi:MAG: GntR family transcriptional regulator [Rhodospirillaceae bacterium]|nr:GntR family transcriptional regulator [Rhodospirillaceae bacterium]